MIECECCDRPVVARKKKGIGFFCDPCFEVCFMDNEHNCNPYNSEWYNSGWRSVVLHSVFKING